jgi:hypothetical protein
MNDLPIHLGNRKYPASYVTDGSLANKISGGDLRKIVEHGPNTFFTAGFHTTYSITCGSTVEMRHANAEYLRSVVKSSFGADLKVAIISPYDEFLATLHSVTFPAHLKNCLLVAWGTSTLHIGSATGYQCFSMDADCSQIAEALRAQFAICIRDSVPVVFAGAPTLIAGLPDAQWCQMPFAELAARAACLLPRGERVVRVLSLITDSPRA